MRRRRSPEIIAGRVAAAGTTRSGEGFYSWRGGLGVYGVKYDKPMRTMSVTVSIESSVSAQYLAVVSAITDTGFNVSCFTGTTANALGDLDWTFVAVGVQQ